MSGGMAILVWCALFAAMSAVGTWLARLYALRRRLIDAPGERRSHAVATPRGGGIAIALAALVALIAMAMRQPLDIVLLVGAGMGLLLVAGIGWLDDHRPLSPWSRLAVHALAAGWLVVGLYLSGRSAPVALSSGLAALVLINAWNFMDGIDGIAGTQAVLVLSFLGITAGAGLPVHLGLAFASAVLGFLPFNMPKARIFMGDAGSGALGYLVALSLGLWLDRQPSAVWPVALMPLSAFLLDTGLTLASRILKRERWWQPHVEHAYQRWSRRAGRHMVPTCGYLTWTLLGCLGGLWAMGKGDGVVAMTVMAWLTTGCLVWVWLRRQPGPATASAEPRG